MRKWVKEFIVELRDRGELSAATMVESLETEIDDLNDEVKDLQNEMRGMTNDSDRYGW